MEGVWREYEGSRRSMKGVECSLTSLVSLLGCHGSPQGDAPGSATALGGDAITGFGFFWNNGRSSSDHCRSLRAPPKCAVACTSGSSARDRGGDERAREDLFGERDRGGDAEENSPKIECNLASTRVSRTGMSGGGGGEIGVWAV